MAKPKDGNIEEVYIAVMGVTGSGKSTFIKECSRLNVGIGHSLKSFTTEVEAFTFNHGNLRIHLVDTPGFDDSDVKESDILRRIAAWLGEAFDQKIKLSGLIYLHRISDQRMPGSAKRSLHMFQRICGPACLPHVTLVTTMWSLAPEMEAVRREQELLQTAEFWGWMIQGGSVHTRHYGGEQAAIGILQGCIARRRPVILNIQQEMKVEGKGLNDTHAGMKLNEELFEMEKKHRKELEYLEKDKQQALREKEWQAAKEIEESQRHFKAEVDKIEKQRQKLEVNVKELQEQREKEFKEIQAKLKAQADTLKNSKKEYDDLKKKGEEDRLKHQRESESRRREREQEMEIRRHEMQVMRDQLEAAKAAARRKGFWDHIGDALDALFD